MSGVHEVSLDRITTDLDIAVLIDNEKRFNLLKNNPYALLFDGRIQLDKLPFGGINIEDINFSKTIT